MKKIAIIILSPIMIPIWFAVVLIWWMLLGDEGIEEASRLWDRIVLFKNNKAISK